MAFGWDDALILGLGAVGNYLGGQQSSPAAPPPPPNYFGADGAMQVWNPLSNAYSTLAARTPTDELATNWGNRLIMNKIMGVGDYASTMQNINSEIAALKGQLNMNNGTTMANEITRRIRDLESTAANLKDVSLGYSPIGQTSDTDLLRYRGATDTVNKYLTDTLNTGYKDALATQAQAQAARGMGQSTMADWGRDEMARRYATDQTGVAMQSEDYFQKLKAADESAKLGVLTAAQGNLGLDAGLASARNSASNAQASLAQQLASYNNELQYNWGLQKNAVNNNNNQNIWQTVAGLGKMAVGGYYGGTAGMLGLNPNYWGTGWNGKNFQTTYGGNNPNSGKKV